MSSPGLHSQCSSDTEIDDVDLESRNLLEKYSLAQGWGDAKVPSICSLLCWPLGHALQFHRYTRTLARLVFGRKCMIIRLLLRIVAVAVLAGAIFVFASLFNGIVRPSYSNPPAHYKHLEARIQYSNDAGRANPNDEKIFIAANIINEDLIRQTWGPNLLELIELLGPENVFVSIYENDSGEGTRDALLELREKLPCNSSVVAGDHIPLSDFPSVTLPDGTHRTKRITYLAEIRNRLLLPLDHPSKTVEWSKNHSTFSSTSSKFDRILFLNDVFFTPTSAAQLLFSTNQNPKTGRAEYASACAIDFIGKAIFYDSFVVRDTEGYEIGFPTYPWFSPTGSALTRNDVLAQRDAVRVRSCWGGMAAFDAAMFMPQQLAIPEEQTSLKENRNRNQNTTLPALRFRSTSEPFWEAAECCLIFADLEVRNSLLTTVSPSQPYEMPSASSGQVFINPYVRVAYTDFTWSWLPTMQRYERAWQFLQFWLSIKDKKPANNPRRTHTPGEVVVDKVWIPADQGEGGKFEMVTRVAEPGGWCGQRKLFLMKEDLRKANAKGQDKNWEQVAIPRGA